MAIIYLTSVSGAPGVSTLATALTLRWPRPALLLEADTSKTTQLIPGYLKAEFKHDRGLTAAALANLRGQLNEELLFAQTLPMGEQGRYGVPGFDDVGGAAAAPAQFWAVLTAALDRMPQAAGTSSLDVFVDAGRYRASDPRGTLMAQADAVLLVTGNTLPDSNALYTALPTLTTMLERAGHQDWLELVLRKSPYKGMFGPTTVGANELKGLLGVNTTATLPWEPDAAAHYSHGSATPSKKSRYLAEVDQLVRNLDEALTSRGYTLQEAN